VNPGSFKRSSAWRHYAEDPAFSIPVKPELRGWAGERFPDSKVDLNLWFDVGAESRRTRHRNPWARLLGARLRRFLRAANAVNDVCTCPPGLDGIGNEPSDEIPKVRTAMKRRRKVGKLVSQERGQLRSSGFSVLGRVYEGYDMRCYLITGLHGHLATYKVFGGDSSLSPPKSPCHVELNR